MTEEMAKETIQQAEEVAPSVTNNEENKEPESPTVDVGMDDSVEAKKLRARRQVEFYFADSNLPYDKFMWTLHTANEEHWVPIATVSSFKRMREFAPLGLPWIVDALKGSEDLEVDSSGEKVRRRTEVKEPAGQFERSVYAKGFGDEDPTLQAKLEEFLNKYGHISAVRMRRDKDKKFKGSVFAEFSDIKTVEIFLNADPKPSWNGEELLIMTKEAYCEMKIKEKGLSGKAAAIRRNNEAKGPNPRGFNAFREMEKAKSKGKGGAEKKPEIWLEFMGSKIRVYEEGDNGGYVKEEDIPYVKGSAMKFSGCGGEVQWEDIKAPLKDRFTRAPFIKFEKGDDFGLVGFDRALTDEDITFIKENVKTVSGKTVSWKPAEESEEREFLIERAQTAAKRAFSSTTRGKGAPRGRGGRGGRGSRGGRGGGRRNDDRGDNKRDSKHNGGSDGNKDTETGEKRKRAVEPDGGPDVGTRGVGVPTIQSSKKAKTDAS